MEAPTPQVKEGEPSISVCFQYKKAAGPRHGEGAEGALDTRRSSFNPAAHVSRGRIDAANPSSPVRSEPSPASPRETVLWDHHPPPERSEVSPPAGGAGRKPEELFSTLVSWPGVGVRGGRWDPPSLPRGRERPNQSEQGASAL